MIEIWLDIHISLNLFVASPICFEVEVAIPTSC